MELKKKDMLIELTEDTLQDLISKNDKVVVQFSASWCGNCRIMKPKFKKLATENEAITFALVDAENFPESRTTRHPPHKSLGQIRHHSQVLLQAHG